MNYLNEREREIVAWFGEVEQQGLKHGCSVRLDKLGTLAVALPEQPSESAQAWMEYVRSQAGERGAVITFCEFGTLALVLPRHAPAQARPMELPLGETKSREEGRRGGKRGKQVEDE